MGYESIAHEAEGEWAIDSQAMSQKYSGRFSLLVGYNI